MSKLDFFPKDSFTNKSFFDNNNLFNFLLDNHPDYIYFKNKDSKFIKVNKKAAEVLGLDHPDEVIGKTDFDFFPDIAEKVRSDEKRIMELGDPQINVPLELRLADGSSHWISMSKVPFYDENKEVAGIVCISRDITKTKNIEQQLLENQYFGN
jgi:PAS domain S-box-containing protein